MSYKASMNIENYNKEAWKYEVKKRNPASIPLSEDVFQRAREGNIQMPLTPTKNVPMDWIKDVKGKKVLCLAASGGQQAPLFALMGADVTVMDLCREQLLQDEYVAMRESLKLRTVQGNMTNLEEFADESFDLVFNAVSNCFVENIEPLWKECYRVLVKGGVLISGFMNPVNYLFDMDELYKNKKLIVRYKIPYSDIQQLDKKRLKEYLEDNEPLEFGHSLEQQIGGQIKAGFSIYGFYEDNSGGKDILDEYISTFIATMAVK